MNRNIGGFTLIELLIVIAIIWIISVWVIIPYNFYSNISKVKISRETINQSLNEARNSAAWLTENTSNKNQNIALIFKKWSNQIDLVWVPFDFSGSLFKESDYKIIRKISLEDNVSISNISYWNWAVTDWQIVVYFRAPNWDRDILIDDTHTGSNTKITIWFKNVKSWILSKEIEIK